MTDDTTVVADSRGKLEAGERVVGGCVIEEI